ncbi:MAG: hypothetical protein ACR2F2_14215, partial [Pyrinomonadaceae bacterium]
MQTNVSVSALAKYTTDLTQLAVNNRLRINDSYQNETARLMKSLSGGELRQTVILDETSENQELVIEQLAIRAAKEFPAKQIIKLPSEFDAMPAVSTIQETKETEGRSSRQLGSLLPTATA